MKAPSKDTPRTNAFRERLPEPRAIEGMLASHGDLERELAAMTAAKDKVVEALKTALGMIERQEADVDYYICDEALREREHIEHLIAELEEVK